MRDATVFSSRLRAARLQAGLTQMQLGVLAQIEEFSASARINQYERGKHQPDFNTAERLAAVLQVPVSYFYTPDDALAKLILIAAKLPPADFNRLLDYAFELSPDD